MILIAISLEEVEDILAEKFGVDFVYFIRDMPAFEIAISSATT
jgi:hypothetical protein